MIPNSDIQAKLNLSVDQLYSELATGVSKGGAPTDPSKRGKEIFKNLKEKLQDNICQSDTVRKAFDSGDRVVLVAALLDCISGAVTGVSPVTFCVLLAKEGLTSLCVTQWKKN